VIFRRLSFDVCGGKVSDGQLLSYGLVLQQGALTRVSFHSLTFNNGEL
jgi:hypothetical protein